MHENRWEVVHRRALFAVIAIACATVVMVGVARLTGAGEFYTPEGQPVASAKLHFTDEADGVVAVYSAASGARIIDYGKDEGGFVRVVMRGFARQRRLLGEGSEVPVELTRYDDGQLWIMDPVSERYVYLGAFGDDNFDAFDEILTREQQTASIQTTESSL